MKPVKIIIVEDQEQFSEALKKVLEEQKLFPCEVVVLNPENQDPLPTFEEFHSKIEEHTTGFEWIVLMDNHLGKWKWSGAHLAPSFYMLVSISTEKKLTAEFNFLGKASIAYHNKQAAKDELLRVLQEVMKKYFSPDMKKELGLS